VHVRELTPDDRIKEATRCAEHDRRPSLPGVAIGLYPIESVHKVHE
jgi:hypothetical protein